MLLGAGFDTRFLRLRSIWDNAVTTFEIDRVSYYLPKITVSTVLDFVVSNMIGVQLLLSLIFSAWLLMK
jgi:O-methyltransferase involved in polyketide biosynthesis